MQSIDQILQQIKKTVQATDPGAILILYGSYARGDSNRDNSKPNDLREEKLGYRI